MKRIMSPRHIFASRRLLGLVLCCSGSLLAILSFAAAPASGTLGPTDLPVSWSGTASGGPSEGESSCVEGVNCDTFTLTLAGAPGDWTGKRAHVQIQWTGKTSYNLFVHKGTNSDPVVASSTQGGTTYQAVDLDPSDASEGTGTFSVHVVYLTSTEPPTQVTQYSGFAESRPVWSIVSSPNTSDGDNLLASVSCPSVDNCWAVGHAANPSPNSNLYHTLIEHWDGTLWNVDFTSQDVSLSTNDVLTGVACPDSNGCWAVGYYYDSGSNPHLLFEHNTGSGWSIDPSSPDVSGFLRAVACSAANDCWAVGNYYGTDGNRHPLLEHNTGSGWNMDATSPNILGYLYAVICAASDDCWAVGGTAVDFVGNPTRPLIEHWDGSSWSIDSTSPNLSSTNLLWGVACSSQHDCWAVGDFNAANGACLIEHNTGSGWTIEPGQFGGDQPQLSGVGCAGPNCWTVGTTGTSSNVKTLIEHNVGAGWHRDFSQNTNTVSAVYSVSCPTAGECWAVGTSSAAIFGSERTLVEHYTAPPVRLTAIVSRKVHATSGTFDIDLTNGAGIECRSGGASGDYTLVFTFANSLTGVGSVSVTSGTGSVASSNIDPTDAHNYIVNLTRVANAQIITVSLTDVTDSVGDFSATVPISMGLLLGDVNASRRVDAADVSSVRQQTLQTVTISNFRNDLNASGRIDAADVSIARQQTLTSLP